MHKSNKIFIDVNFDATEMSKTKFKLNDKQRLIIDIENYVYYQGGKNILKKLDQIFNTITYLKELNDYELNKVKFTALQNFYSELFYLLDFNDKILALPEYDLIFNEYLDGIFNAKTPKQYKKITKKFVLFENDKLLEFFPFLKNKEDIGEGFLVALNALLPKRLYTSNRVYLPEMYKFYFSLIIKGYKRIPASDEAFKKFFTQAELDKLKDLEKKKDSFRRQASRMKI